VKQQELFGPATPASPDPKTRPPEPSKRAAVPEARGASVPATSGSGAFGPRAPEPESARPAWRRAPAEAPPERAAPLTVSQLTARIKERLESGFTRLVVRGEVSGFRGANARGHLYFSLKDAGASIDVRVWQSTARDLRFTLKDGVELIAEGTLDVYGPAGRYSLIVQRIEPAGFGARAAKLEALKARLAREGLLGPTRSRPKRALPFLPRRIGVVTSVTGAALRDFLKVLHRRHPRLSVLVADARVQGDGAAFELRRAIRALGRTNVDVIVVTRGGGSADDLWAFDEEAVVRAIFESPVPVVSAVGHEIDTTLADLVADVRAPTPRAAAEALAPVLSELELALAALRARLARAAERVLASRRSQLRALRGEIEDPRRVLAHERLRLDGAADRLLGALQRRIRGDRGALRAKAVRLQQLRPQAQLVRRRERLESLEARLIGVVRRRSSELKTALGRLALGLERGSPRPAVLRLRQGLGHQSRRLTAAARQRAQLDRQRLLALEGRLEALSPLKVLGRGYAIVRRSDGSVVRRASDVEVGDGLRVHLSEGDALQAAVTQVNPRPK
jgi:exodeoxyribonuclease VII large subunit